MSVRLKRKNCSGGSKREMRNVKETHKTLWDWLFPKRWRHLHSRKTPPFPWPLNRSTWKEVKKGRKVHSSRTTNVLYFERQLLYLIDPGGVGNSFKNFDCLLGIFKRLST